jgi:hypothetical protein
MQTFRFDRPQLAGDLAAFPAASDDYVVTLSVQRKDGKSITEREARLAYTQVLPLYPLMKSIGGA